MAEQSQDDIIQDLTPYQMTLMAMVFPWRAHAVFNVFAGLGLGLVGAPLLGSIWALSLCLADWISQRLYRNWLLAAAETDSTKGLARLSWIVFMRMALWFAPPLAHTVAAHSQTGFAFVAVTGVHSASKFGRRDNTALGPLVSWL